MIKSVLILCLISGVLMSFAGVKSDKKLEKKVHRIHENCLTVDTHCDTPMLMVAPNFNIRDEHQAPKSRVDFPRMKKGGLDAMFFAVFTGQKPRAEENYKKTYALANQMLDSIHSALKHNADLATLALKADDLTKIEKTGKRAIYIGMENGFRWLKIFQGLRNFIKEEFATLRFAIHSTTTSATRQAMENRPSMTV